MSGASKTEAERAIWRIAKESSAKFQVSTILPNAMFGPLLKPGGVDSSSTATWLLNLFNGDVDAFDSFPLQYYVDVRDTARLHSIALRDPSCSGQRLFSFAAPFNRSDVLALFRELRPGKTFAADDRETGRDLSIIPNEEANEIAEEALRQGLRVVEGLRRGYYRQCLAVRNVLASPRDRISVCARCHLFRVAVLNQYC